MTANSKNIRLLQTTFQVLAAVPIITGLLDLLLGLSANNSFGVSLSEGQMQDHILNSQYRFLGAIWIGVGLLLYKFASDLNKNAGFIKIILGAIILGGLGRVGTLLQFGIPEVVTGKVFVFSMIALEVFVMLGLYIWLNKITVSKDS